MKLMIRVIVLRNNCEPVVEEIPDGLDGLYSVIGSPVEMLRVTAELDLWFNEHGRLNGMVPNRRAGDYDIFGPMLIARRTDDGDTISLTDEDIARWLPECAGWWLFVG